MSLFSCLEKYKKEFVNQGESDSQRKFLEDSFFRWYIESEKDTIDGILPVKNVISTEHRSEFDVFNDRFPSHSFDIDYVIQHTQIQHDKYIQFCFPLLKDKNFDNLDHLITSKQLTRLKDLYKGSDFKTDKNKLIYLYRFLGMTNIHLSVPPIFKGVEMFGSPLNTHNLEFCSPFMFESRFGSLGSFFDYTKTKSVAQKLHVCNPPFDEITIDKMADSLEVFLAGNPNITVVITIPVWDSQSQKKMKIADYGLDFRGYEKLIKSKYFKEASILNKFKFPYYNYYSEKLIPASYTHLIILCSGFPELTIKKIKQLWLKFTKKFKK